MTDTVYLVGFFLEDPNTKTAFVGPSGLTLDQESFLIAVGIPGGWQGDSTERWRTLKDQGIADFKELEEAWLRWVESHEGMRRVDFLEIE